MIDSDSSAVKDRTDRQLEWLPVLVFAALGLVLVVGVLAATSSTDGQDPPSWYPRDEAVRAPAVDTSSSTTTPAPAGPSISVDPGSTPNTSDPAPPPTSEGLSSVGLGRGGEDTSPGWRLAAGLPAYQGALSGVEVVAGGDTDTFIAAGADQHGVLVLASTGPDSWRELPREGLPPKSYARAVAATQDAVVVAGADATGPAVWQLAGDSWRRASADDAGGGSVVFADLAVRNDTWVLVGFNGEATGFWVRTPESERFAAVAPGAVTGPTAEEVLVREVVATDAGFVAVGQAGGRAVRWFSVDGVDWSGELLVAGEDATAMGVTADGETIVGYDGVGGVLWTRRHGDRTLVRLPAPSGAPQIGGTVAKRFGRTLVVGVEAGTVRCWETDDNARPPQRCDDSTALDSASSIGAVVAHRGGFLGVGQIEGEGMRAGQVGVWALALG